ncbi:MAG: DMT family transporter [Egibacteraceae bacterium]
MTTEVVTAPARRARLQRAGRRQPLALISAGVVLYSIGPVLVAASSVSGPVFSFWRLWLGVPVLGVVTWLYVRAGGQRPTTESLRWPLWAGLAFGLHQLLFMTAIKATSVTDVALMNTLAPLVVAIAAVPLFGERPGTSFRAWTLLAIGGTVVVVLGATSGPEGDPVGMALAAVNVLAFTAFFLLSKLSREHIAVMPFLLGVMVVAALTVSAYVAMVGEPIAAVGRRDVLFAFVVAAGPGALGHFVSTWPLRWVAANIPPVLRLGQPAISGVLAFMVIGQAITPAHLIGGALTIAGVCGAVLSRRRFAADETPAPAG